MNVCMSFNNTPSLLDSVVCTPVLTGTLSSSLDALKWKHKQAYPAGETQTHHSPADRPAASACIFSHRTPHRHAHLIIPPGKE